MVSQICIPSSIRTSAEVHAFKVFISLVMIKTSWTCSHNDIGVCVRIYFEGTVHVHQCRDKLFIRLGLKCAYFKS